MTNLAVPVSIEMFKSIMMNLSPDIAACVRGRHAIGKSECVYQVAQSLKLPVVERRLSQLTEGDIVGLPFMHGEDQFNEEGEKTSYASTQFKPCDWLIEACEHPVMLFLDERNRALEGVKQAVFQLTDSKAFYGNKLHPDTRIIIAENVGDDYQVQQCDPAEVSRCITVVLDPSVEEWLKYASDKCHIATVEFIRQNEKYLEHTTTFEPNKKYPDRRSWFKLDAELQRLELVDEPENPLFYHFSAAFIGVEAAQAFSAFCKDRDRQVSAKDILKSWAKSKKRLAAKNTISNAAYVECVNKLTEYLNKHLLSDKEAEQISLFMHDCPPEPRMAAWSILQKKVENLFKVHPYIDNLMVVTASGKSTADLKPKTAEEIKKAKEKKTKEKATPKKSTTATKRGKARREKK
jgi:hypothetical protein